MKMKIPEPIQNAQDSIFELDFFVKLAWAGLGYAKSATRLAESIRRAKISLGDELEDDYFYQARLEDTKKLEIFANRQVKEGFSYLYETAIIRLWAILETAADDLVLTLLEKFPKVLETEIIQNLKGPLVDFLQASEKERAALLFERLKREVDAQFKPGVGRFEVVFKAIDFGGPVPDDARRQLLELSEVRHSIVHRNSKADVKVIERCPWLGLKMGGRIRLTHKRYMHYWMAVACYLSELLRRCVVTGFSQPGCPDPKDRIREFQELRDEIDAKLADSKTTNKTLKDN